MVTEVALVGGELDESHDHHDDDDDDDDSERRQQREIN